MYFLIHLSKSFLSHFNHIKVERFKGFEKQKTTWQLWKSVFWGYLKKLITVLTLKFATEEYNYVLILLCLFRRNKFGFRGWNYNNHIIITIYKKQSEKFLDTFLPCKIIVFICVPFFSCTTHMPSSETPCTNPT